MARKCFYSFHFTPDCWRAATVRGIGVIEGNEPAKDNEWDRIASGPDSDAKIKRWIDQQMNGKTCGVVLIGSDTANRKWINHEIVTAWNLGLGLVGININGLKNTIGQTSTLGANPFEFVKHGPTGQPLSSIVKRSNPSGTDSRERYAWIARHLANAVEEAIDIRGKHV